MTRVREQGRRAVLRGDDQRAGRAPTHCVISGESTGDAVRIRAGTVARAELLQLVLGDSLTALLSPGSLTTTLPVARVHWRIWRRRLGVAVVVSAIGAGLLITGIARGQGASIGIGAVMILVGGGLRAWFARAWWIGLRYDRSRDLVVVSRTSNAFADDAKRLFVAAVNRR